jgi:glycosidase
MTANGAEDMQEDRPFVAREFPNWLKSSVMYQVFLRRFTAEGTIKAAKAKLPMLAELGVDLVYLCPVCVADTDMDKDGWSPRHHASKSEDPRNPYRISDYYTIDPEYGTDQDLHDFVEAAHNLGMRVLLDIVFFHCGPNAVFLKEHPDFVVREEDGTVKVGNWRFPMLNFESNELREYLWDNLEYWMREFDVDGYRCDVSSAVPLDFWVEARKRLEVLNPQVIVLSEGERKSDQLYAFDMNYSFAWSNRALASVFRGEQPASHAREQWETDASQYPEGALLIRYTDNHDIANDAFENRPERAWTHAGMDAALTLLFTLDGIPFLYNGQEIADEVRHSIYYGVAETVQWDLAESPVGSKRFALVQKLCDLRHNAAAMSEGNVRWLDNDAPESVLSFVRETDDEQMLVVVNTRNEAVAAEIGTDGSSFQSVVSAKATVAEGKAELGRYGFFVGRKK